MKYTEHIELRVLLGHNIYTHTCFLSYPSFIDYGTVGYLQTSTYIPNPDSSVLNAGVRIFLTPSTLPWERISGLGISRRTSLFPLLFETNDETSVVVPSQDTQDPERHSGNSLVLRARHSWCTHRGLKYDERMISFKSYC